MKHQKKEGGGPRGYVLTLVPEPGTDAIRSLRWALKGLLRRHHLRCVDLREAGGEHVTPIPSLKEAS
jgi:hypothetical protein